MEETIALAVPLLAFVIIPYVLAMLMDLMQGMLRGLGFSTGPMIISLITVVGVRIVWSQLIFPLFAEDYYSIFKLYLCYIISYVLNIAVLGVYIALNRRKIRKNIEAVSIARERLSAEGGK